MNFPTGSEAKKIIKKLGFDSRKVSCNVRPGSYTMNVRVKDLSIPLEPIEDALKQFERINRCEYSGEILQGGNRFIFVQYESFIPVNEAVVDAYTMALTMNGKPKDHTSEYHFKKAMLRADPSLTESQVAYGFREIFART